MGASLRLAAATIAFLCGATAALGQSSEAELLVSKLASIRYSPLAEAARVQGDVQLAIHSGATAVVSGPPLLRQVVSRNADSIGAFPRDLDLTVTFHFVIAETATIVPVSVTVPRGDRFDRAILRLLGLKTKRVVTQNECHDDAPPPPSQSRIAGDRAEMWVYGRPRCLMPESTIIARR